MGVLGAGLFLQFGFDRPVSSATADLAAADRSAEGSANRGSARSDVQPVATDPSTTVAPVETTTTVPVEVTTTVPVTAAPATTAALAPTTTAPRPRVTTTTKAPAPRVAPAPTAAPAVADGDAVWRRLAQCESGMRNDLGAPYYGYFQFSAQTWTGIGGTGLPSDHTWDEQLAMAKKLQARSGWGQWPVCGKKALNG